MSISTDFAQALQDKFDATLELEQLHGKNQWTVGTDFSVESGQKFDRIVQARRSDYSGRSVHAFVEKATGKLIKAGGWKAPQKDKDGPAYRFDLSTTEGFTEALNAADLHGGYLYKH